MRHLCIRANDQTLKVRESAFGTRRPGTARGRGRHLTLCASLVALMGCSSSKPSDAQDVPTQVNAAVTATPSASPAAAAVARFKVAASAIGSCLYSRATAGAIAGNPVGAGSEEDVPGQCWYDGASGHISLAVAVGDLPAGSSEACSGRWSGLGYSLTALPDGCIRVATESQANWPTSAIAEVLVFNTARDRGASLYLANQNDLDALATPAQVLRLSEAASAIAVWLRT